MGRLRVKATEIKYKEQDRKLKDQLLNSTNDQTMTPEIMKEETVIKDTSKIPSE